MKKIFFILFLSLALFCAPSAKAVMHIIDGAHIDLSNPDLQKGYKEGYADGLQKKEPKKADETEYGRGYVFGHFNAKSKVENAPFLSDADIQKAYQDGVQDGKAGKEKRDFECDVIYGGAYLRGFYIGTGLVQ